ncbi:MAG: hypothetical protein HRU19_17290 [Pseudobacteriovorax sp.]|nr:hypothetical protein [Pseudobacteriovorax sp.]
MLRPVWVLIFGLLGLSACETRQVEGDIEDFSLGPGLDTGPDPDHSDYYDEVATSAKSIPFLDSFPVGIVVGRKYSPFFDIPGAAKTPKKSALAFRAGKDCSFVLITKAFQAVRYLYTGKWVKFQEATPNIPFKLNPKEKMSLQFWSELDVFVPKKYRKGCAKKLMGRRTHLGEFHMLNSKARLLASPKTPDKAFVLSKTDKPFTKVFLHWPKRSPQPLALNDLDFPAVVKSAYHRLKVGDRGFYYVSLQALLEHRRSKKRVLNIQLRSLKAELLEPTNM